MYEAIFDHKDQRRSEMITASFYETFVLKSPRLFDPTHEGEAEMNKQVHMLPSFRNEMKFPSRR